MLNIALFGPPGAGKGTQSKLLIEKYNLTYISTGDILRQEIAENSELGKEAKDIIANGHLVSDELIVKIIERRIRMNSESKGILFDGFPRTLVQAYILDGLLLKMNASLACMISLEVPDEVLVERLLERGKSSGRSDDNLEVIKNRLVEYKTKTAPVAQYYDERNLLYKLKGTGTIKEIHGRIKNAINTTLKREWMNVVVAGAPGAGKGTQGRLLAEKYNLYYISTGSKLRNEMKNNTEIGKQVKAYLDRGELVPDEIVIKLIEREIKKHSNVNGFVFKGFPRTIIQVYILDGLLRKLNSSVSYCVNLDIPTLESIKRLSARGKTQKGRSYDKDTDLIISRLEEFQKRTLPVIEYYNKIDKTLYVNAHGSRQEVFERLSASVEESFKYVR